MILSGYQDLRTPLLYIGKTKSKKNDLIDNKLDLINKFKQKVLF